MSRAAHATYRGIDLFVFEAWQGMHVYFVTYPIPDPPCFWDVRPTFDEAVDAGAEFILEATNEQSPRSNS